MTKLDEYLRITEAAAYVGVAPNTLRNWGRSGKLTERRHPMNGYRLYARPLSGFLTFAGDDALRTAPRHPPQR